MASLISSLEINTTWELSPYCGIPVSTDIAQKTFCALGDDQWMQVYDGKYHCFGKMVFDEGLHGREAEAGFLGSALKVLDFGKDKIGAESIGDLYCPVHKIACSHFRGAANNTKMLASEAGRFRDRQHSGVQSRVEVEDVLIFFDRADLKDDRRRSLINEFTLIRNYEGDEILNRCSESHLKDRRKFLTLKFLTPPGVEELETLLQKKIGETSECLQKLKKDPQFGKACPSLSILDRLVRIEYASPRWDGCSFEEIIPHVFSEFDRSIAAIDAELLQIDLSDKRAVENLTNQKLVLIADLFQKLEWFHPFPDGQGRTDLIILGMLLSKHGFCPAILDEPYVSTFAPLADWVSYLKEGMTKWQQAAKASAIFNQSV